MAKPSSSSPLDASVAESQSRAKLGKSRTTSSSPKPKKSKKKVDGNKSSSELKVKVDGGRSSSDLKADPISPTDNKENGRSSRRKSSAAKTSKSDDKDSKEKPERESRSRKVVRKVKSTDDIPIQGTRRSSSKVRGSKRGKSVSTRSRSLSVSANNRKSSRNRSVSRSRSSETGKPSAPPAGRVKRNKSMDQDDRFSVMTALQTQQDSSGGKQEQEDHNASLNALVYKLKDTSLEEELFALFKRIEKAEGFPAHRKESGRSNQTTVNMCKALRNDPDVTTMVVQNKEKFQEVEKSLRIEFAEGLRSNLHLTTLIMKGVDLKDDFLIAVSHSIQDNFSLENLILPNNLFTSDALVEFCCCLHDNATLRNVDLRNQETSSGHPSILLKEHERAAMEAIITNKYILALYIAVSSEKCMGLIKMVCDRNRKTPKGINYDKKLLDYLESEANNAEQLINLNLDEEKLKHQFKRDLTLLCNLADIAEINKKEISGDGKEVKRGSEAKNKLPSDSDMSSDGSFLTSSFISKFIEDDPSTLGVMFNFKGQSAMFKKFHADHDARETIVKKFVEALVTHKKANEMTRLIMTDSGCEDDFVVALCERCLGSSKALPKLFLFDLRANCLSNQSITALCKCLEDKKTFRYLQVLRLQGQYSASTGRQTFFSLASEFELTRTLCLNLSIVRLTLKVRHDLERIKIEGYLARNMEMLGQARVMSELEGKIKHTRNDLEQQVDRLAENDPAVWLFDVSGDQRFLSLKRKDVLKVAKSLANNKFVTEVRLDRVDLDDDFAVQLGESLASNTAIRVLSLEGNCIGGRGIKAIMTGLTNNKTLVDLRLKFQVEEMSTNDENELVRLLGENEVILKLGVNVNSMQTHREIVKLLASNQQNQWKTSQHRRSLPAATNSGEQKQQADQKRKSMD